MKSKSEVVSTLGRPLCICDSTLRGGEQAAGVVFSNIEKYRIAQLLDQMGVPQIEAGIPMLGAEEKKAVRHIARMGLKASVVAWNRAEISDIDNSLECDVDSVVISMPASASLITNSLKKDGSWVLDKIYETVAYAAEHGLYVICSAEDAARADLGYLIEFAKTAKDAGADRFRYCDSIGVSEPFDCYDRMKMLRQIIGMGLEFEAANDFGLATANTLAAVKAGAGFACTTIGGLGERSGFAPTEEVAMGARHMLNVDAGLDLTKLPLVAKSVSAASGRAIPESKPMLGSAVFSQESGVHADGSSDDAYEPEEVGLKRDVVIGKHSVRNTVIAAMAGLGIDISREDADKLLSMARRTSVINNRSVSGEELFLLYNDMMAGVDLFDEEEYVPAPAEPAPAPEAPVEPEQQPQQ